MSFNSDEVGYPLQLLYTAVTAAAMTVELIALVSAATTRRRMPCQCPPFDVPPTRAQAMLPVLLAHSSSCARYRLQFNATMCSMLGPGLALRGPDGSMHTAVDGLTIEYRICFLFFAIGELPPLWQADSCCTPPLLHTQMRTGCCAVLTLRPSQRERRARTGVLAFFLSALLYACISFFWPVALCVALVLCSFCVRIFTNVRRIYRKFELRATDTIDGRMLDDADAGNGNVPHSQPVAHRHPGGVERPANARMTEAARVISRTQGLGPR